MHIIIIDCIVHSRMRHAKSASPWDLGVIRWAAESASHIHLQRVADSQHPGVVAHVAPAQALRLGRQACTRHPLPSQLEVQAVSDLEVTIALMRPGNLLPSRTGINASRATDGRPAREPEPSEGPT